ncbi:hypothetical protein [Paraburkholderia bannensis]|uniref:hypothetical protein n=1 Tax=Paraburkholderia bannensis TaxID=765414 RepID=UPI002ABE744D|nr:hypothetical protein [Paraburkholderia bannensis]
MKKMRTLVAMLLVGTGAMRIIFPTPVLAEQNIKTQSGQSEGAEMDRNPSSAHVECFFLVIDEAMAILRGGKPFDYDKAKLGSIKRVESATDDSGKRYYYNNDLLPDAMIRMVTESDPLNYKDDRLVIPPVPSSFYLQFVSSVYGMDRAELEKRLSLESYWIDGNGERHNRNSLPSFPPAISLHVYRYREKELASSHFPVDVELFYFDPKDGDEKREPALFAVSIRRAYPYLTPEIRKKNREAQQSR